MIRYLRALVGRPSILRAVALAALVLAGCSAEPAFAITTGATGLNLNSVLQGAIVNATSFGSLKQDLNISQGLQLTGGTGAGQIDTFYAGSVTISASGSTTLDLNGTLTDAFGNTVNFLHVKFIALVAASGNTNACQIGPGASNPFAGPWTGTTPLTAVAPGEAAIFTDGQGSNAGWPVTASTGDIIKLANSSSGTSVTCSVYIAGTST